MKTRLLLIAIIATLASCALPPIDGANPLDRPQDLKSSSALHEENVQAITSNPGYRIPE